MINESLNVVDFVEDKSKNTNDVDTNKEVHNCVAKGFSNVKKEFTEDKVEKVNYEVRTEKEENLSNCNDCGNVYPSANALRSHTRYKHLRKTCNIREKTFQGLYKLKSHKKTIHEGRTNLQGN